MTTYYLDPEKPRADKEERDADIRGKIEQIRVEFPRAGYRPLLGYLKRHGLKVGETRLRRILRESNLFVKPKKKFVVTTQSDHDELIYPNLLQEMSTDNINQVWTAHFECSLNGHQPEEASRRSNSP
jgi:putative transposase